MDLLRGALRPPAPSYPSAPRRKRWNARAPPSPKRPVSQKLAVSRLHRLAWGGGHGRFRPWSREPQVVRQACAAHSALIHAIPALSAYRPPDQLAFAARPALARRGALSAVSRDRICAGI